MKQLAARILQAKRAARGCIQERAFAEVSAPANGSDSCGELTEQGVGGHDGGSQGNGTHSSYRNT